MSYNVVKEKLDKGKIIILDGGMGAELEKSGAKTVSYTHLTLPTKRIV